MIARETLSNNCREIAVRESAIELQAQRYSVSRTHEVHLTPAFCPLPSASKPKTLYLTSMRTAIYRA